MWANVTQLFIMHMGGFGSRPYVIQAELYIVHTSYRVTDSTPTWLT